MRCNSIVEVKKRIESYLKSGNGALIVNVHGIQSYKQMKAYLESTMKILSTSNFCKHADEFPNLIDMLTEIRKTNTSIAVFGLYEHLVFSGDETMRSTINTILYNLNNASKVVFLFFNGDNILNEFIKSDRRLKNNILFLNDEYEENFECVFLNKTHTDISSYNICSGYKSLLYHMEIKENKNLIVKTELANYISKNYSKSKMVDSPHGYLVVTGLLPAEISAKYGSDEQWRELSKEIKGMPFDKFVINKFGEGSQLERCLADWKAYTDFERWLLWLTLKTSNLSDSYIKSVMLKCDKYENFESRYADVILDFDTTEHSYYAERRIRLGSILNESIMRIYIKKAEAKGNDIIYYLTDVFEVEREAIIKWCSLQNTLSSHELSLIRNAYPMLYDYLDKYNYKNEIFNNYFYQYKLNKVRNRITDEFLSLVNDIAIERPYNSLQTRNQVFESLDKNDASVLFVDALGLEFMSIISSLCKKNSLVFDMSIVRANIPSITAENKYFLEGVEREPDYRLLDTLKHKGKDKYNYEKTKLPIHITKELEYINEIINLVLDRLDSSDRVIVVTDHGASRLAVINKKKQTYPVDSKVRELGRCCEYYEGIGDLSIPYWTKDDEGQYCVLANYDRFGGKGAPVVETHGGATLEEVAIPVITFRRLGEQAKIGIVGSKEIQFKLRQKCTIKFFISKPYENVQLRINDDYYDCAFDGYHYTSMPDIKKAGKYVGEVYSDGNKVGKIDFTLVRSIKENNLDI